MGNTLPVNFHYSYVPPDPSVYKPLLDKLIIGKDEVAKELTIPRDYQRNVDKGIIHDIFMENCYGKIRIKYEEENSRIVKDYVEKGNLLEPPVKPECDFPDFSTKDTRCHTAINIHKMKQDKRYKHMASCSICSDAYDKFLAFVDEKYGAGEYQWNIQLYNSDLQEYEDKQEKLKEQAKAQTDKLFNDFIHSRYIVPDICEELVKYCKITLVVSEGFESTPIRLESNMDIKITLKELMCLASQK